MTKVVINACHGGFGLSAAAVVRYHEIKCVPLWVDVCAKYQRLGVTHYWLVPESERVPNKEGEDFYKMSIEERREHNRLYSEQIFSPRDVGRSDPALVQAVEELGQEANGKFACLKIVEIPDDVEWEIGEYDGREWVAEKHRTWD